MAARQATIEAIEGRIQAATEAILNDQPRVPLDLGPLSSLPGRSLAEVKRVEVLLRVLDIIHQALVENVVVTKRDIFYRDPDLFGNQGVVDRAVDSLARKLGVSRASLNVTATARGVVVGDFTWSRNSGERLSGLANASGTLVSDIADNEFLQLGDVAWILVVEKDMTNTDKAVFRSLASARLHSFPGLKPGVIITGKGYPDVATRLFLMRLSISHRRHSSAPRMYALVDNDPDGISILSTYKYGSVAFEHQNLALQAPRLELLGVRLRDISARDLEGGTSAPDSEESQRGLLPLTTRDRLKALSVLRSGVCKEDGLESDWRRELQVMLMMNLKTEIQILEEQQGGVVKWLRDRLPASSPDNTVP